MENEQVETFVRQAGVMFERKRSRLSSACHES
jgi:hypothetical protein